MRKMIYSIILIIIFLLLFIISLSIGAVQAITLSTIIHALEIGRVTGVIRYRLVRSVASIILGAGLGLSGLTMQYALRNPLSDPYLLGVSAGASLGILLAVIYGGSYSPALIYGVALFSGIVTFLAVVAIGAGAGGSPSALIVSGVSVSYALSGVSIMLFIKNISKINMTFIWLFGTIAYVIPIYLIYSSLILFIIIIILIFNSSRIYSLILGDDVSESMGVDVKKTRYIALLSSGGVASAMVALAGPVGFIGLAAPWMARLMYGSKYSTVLASSMVIGAILAQISDIMVRVIGGAQEIPLTAFTALFGGPLLFYLTRKTGW